MQWKTLTIVDVIFHAQELSQDTLQTLEQFLRKQDNIDNLIIHPQGIDFYIWGLDEVDYLVLDEFKSVLKGAGCSDFEITAREYSFKDIKYYYADLKKAGDQLSLDSDTDDPESLEMP